MSFLVSYRDTTTRARVARLELPHGPVDLPAFMPVGTAATVKAMAHQEIDDLGYRLILGNTYHLVLRPGVDVIRDLGGLHAFSTWPHNLLTDSGGYQVFSLASLRTIGEEGVSFRSHVDGAMHQFTPEGVVDAQVAFGSDIQMALDVCSAYDTPRDQVVEASERTTRWAERARDRWQTAVSNGYRGLLFGIVQGGFDLDLRRVSAQQIGSLGFPGVAIGGLSVGEPKPVFQQLLAETAPLLPEDVPRYLMGIGTPDYIFDAVANGIDMFDCVFPTRIARNGTVFTRDGRLVLRHEAHGRDDRPIEPECSCRVCRRYSRAYLRHLFKSREILGPMLATHHNLAFMARLMDEIRVAIGAGSFAGYARGFLDRYTAGERERLDGR